MLSKRYKILVGITLCFLKLFPESVCSQRCAMEYIDRSGDFQEKTRLSKRSTYSFQIVFHVLYSNADENISLAQVYSQMEILNDVFNSNASNSGHGIPGEFKNLKDNPDIRFCLATKDPNGQSTNGINSKKINSISIACKQELGMRSIMHESLGGIDVWDPQKYINVYIVNRDECNALGEAVFPWDASQEEDGIIVDFRVVGSIGTASGNSPFHKGLTLVHEMGHYFGLYHLSADVSNCMGSDLVDDTPPQSKEYLGCPDYPQISCGNNNMTMNYMSLVNDVCMKLFTKGQVRRMHEIIEIYKKTLAENSCLTISLGRINDVYLISAGSDWLLLNSKNEKWTAFLELYDNSGKLIWKHHAINSLTVTVPYDGTIMPSGIYFLRIYDENNYKNFKISK